MNIEFLPFTHEELPVQKSFEIDGVNYNISVDYNWRNDFFTFSIYDDDDNPVFTGKAVYLENIIDAVVEGLNLSKRIIPLIVEDVLKEFPETERISLNNFNSVRLALL